MSEPIVISEVECRVDAGHGLNVGDKFYVPIVLVDMKTGEEKLGNYVVEVTVVDDE